MISKATLVIALVICAAPACLFGQTSGLDRRIEETVRVRQSSWFAVRVTGRPSRGIGSGFIPRAHSGVVSVLVDGKSVLVRKDLELMLRWIDRLWAYLEERNNYGSPENRAQALRTFNEARAHYQAKLNAM